jgi:hypothetical protein
METKICSKCGKELPATEEYFPVVINTYAGKKRFSFRTYCKKCRKEYETAWRLKNKNTLNAKRREYYKTPKGQEISLKNRKIKKEKDPNYHQRYSKTNKDKINAKALRHRKELYTCYVKQTIRRCNPEVSAEDIPLKAVEFKRQLILLNRIIKSEQNARIQD